MKCTNKTYKKLCFMLAICLLAWNLIGCGAKEYTFSYDMDRNNSSFSVAAHTKGNRLEPFVSGLCFAAGDVTTGTEVDMSQATAAGLFDLTAGNVIYAKNIHERMNPASLTKILTALCALKYSNLDDMLTASENVYLNESSATKLGIAAGDTMTMNQALHAMLVKSANDVAIMIAEHVGGSVENFSNMMNEMAVSLGATNSHFVNPHGLTEPDHYTTVYDLYLICNEAVKNETFVEIIHSATYTSIYHDKNGKEKTIDVTTTNAYLKGEAFAPNDITVVGGKTGTTSAAGNCLLLFLKNSSGDPYISIILQSVDRTIMYQQMTNLLNEI